MAARLLVFLMLLGMVPTAIAEDGSVVRIDHSFTLIEYDPGIEDAAIHVLMQKCINQKALSVYKGVVMTNYIDVHTIEDLEEIKNLLNK